MDDKGEYHPPPPHSASQLWQLICQDDVVQCRFQLTPDATRPPRLYKLPAVISELSLRQLRGPVTASPARQVPPESCSSRLDPRGTAAGHWGDGRQPASRPQYGGSAPQRLHATGCCQDIRPKVPQYQRSISATRSQLTLLHPPTLSPFLSVWLTPPFPLSLHLFRQSLASCDNSFHGYSR